MRRDRAIKPIGAGAKIDDGRGAARDTIEQRGDAFAVELTMEIGRARKEWDRAPRPL